MKIFNFGTSILALLLFSYLLIGINSYIVFNTVGNIVASQPMTTKDHRFFFIAVFVAVYSIGSLLSTLLYGGYRDQYGRRKVLLLSLLILAIGYVISGAAIGIYWIPILFLGQFISGVGDSFCPFAFTILADIYQRPFQRMTAFGIFAASDGVLSGTYLITNFWKHFPSLELSKYPAIPYYSVAAIGILIWLIFF